MTLGGVRGYFRTHLDAVGLSEWRDGFNFENIPANILDRAYHIEVGTTTTGPANQMHYTFQMPITVRVFLKGFRDPSQSIDDALDLANTIYAEVLDAANRLQTAGLKDIRPTSVFPQPLQLTNDNAVILELGFIAYLIYGF